MWRETVDAVGASAQVIIVTVLSLSFLDTAAFGYNSIITADGYDAPNVTLTKGDHRLVVAASKHFIIKTTLPLQAAQHMTAHLEVWHDQLLKVLPRAPQVFTEKHARKVTMYVFAYPEQKGQFYGNPEYAKGNTTDGVSCRDTKTGNRAVHITALQHEVYHFWNDIFMGLDESAILEEGGADFFGMWDIDKSTEYNLSGINYPSGWEFLDSFKAGKAVWISCQDAMAGHTPAGGRVYQQGWLLFHFLMNSEVGKKHARVIFTAYATDTESVKMRDRLSSYVRVKGKRAVFDAGYTTRLEDDWKTYLRQLTRPTEASIRPTTQRSLPPTR